LQDPPAVVINARAAGRAEIGGVERYARELAARLPALNPERYRVIRPPAGLEHRAGHVWEQTVLPAMRGTLLYSPANLAPALSGRNVVVIHDVAPLRHPEAFSRTYLAYQRLMLPAIAKRARVVITVSEFSKGELIETLDVPPEHIAVVPGGVDQRFRPDADPAPSARAFGLHRPYVLSVGTNSERKRFDALEPVARALAGQGFELVLAGSMRGYLRGDPPPGIRWLGYVPERLLPGLYAGAEAFVLPSRYEGFGLPCLEAMASGVAVVAARAGALPEVCGDAAVLADPDQLSDAVLAVATDDLLRARLAARGRERAVGYSWDQSAARTDEVIGELLAGPRLHSL
jgi:glycosyltransferase involved in cell wall biosynthesis